MGNAVGHCNIIAAVIANGLVKLDAVARNSRLYSNRRRHRRSSCGNWQVRRNICGYPCGVIDLAHWESRL